MGFFAKALDFLGGGILSSFLSGLLGLANTVAGVMNKRADADVAKFTARNGAVQELGGQALQVAAAREEGQRSIAIQAMTHPIWWVAWIGFVMPPMVYDAMIYFVSTFDAWLNTPGCHVWEIGKALPLGKLCEWYVRKVPLDQQASRANIIYFIFGAQVLSGPAAAMTQAAQQWLTRK